MTRDGAFGGGHGITVNVCFGRSLQRIEVKCAFGAHRYNKITSSCEHEADVKTQSSLLTHLEQDVVNSNSLLKWDKFLFTDKSVVSY